jgi:hypothetical protein
MHILLEYNKLINQITAFSIEDIYFCVCCIVTQSGNSGLPEPEFSGKSFGRVISYPDSYYFSYAIRKN